MLRKVILVPRFDCFQIICDVKYPVIPLTKFGRIARQTSQLSAKPLTLIISQCRQMLFQSLRATDIIVAMGYPSDLPPNPIPNPLQNIIKVKRAPVAATGNQLFLDTNPKLML